jgi:hypothetical protein
LVHLLDSPSIEIFESRRSTDHVMQVFISSFP